MLELSEVKKDLQAKEDLIHALQSESQKLQYVLLPEYRNKHLFAHIQFHRIVLCRAQGEQHAHEVSRFQAELAEAHSQLQILWKQLDEETAKQPLTNQEVRIIVVVLICLADGYLC